MSVLCIVFSVLLVTAIFSMADMALRAQKSYFIKTNGEYHASVTGISEETAELIGARLDVAVCGWTYQGSMCQRRCDFVVFRRTGNVEKWRVKVYSP